MTASITVEVDSFRDDAVPLETMVVLVSMLASLITRYGSRFAARKGAGEPLSTRWYKVDSGESALGRGARAGGKGGVPVLHASYGPEVPTFFAKVMNEN